MEKRTVKIRDLEIGSGSPKICVPLVAANQQELQKELERMTEVPCDLAEWRVDFYEGIEQEEVRQEALRLIRRYLGYKPLLFTFRTAKEGGHRSISPEEYFKLNLAAAKSGLIDLVDVEIYRDEEMAEVLIKALHKQGVFVLGSNHDFEKTPEKAELIRRLCRMQELGTDLTKIAVMPQKKQDVLELLSAAAAMEETYADRPCITMSMGTEGVISRIAGSFSGSAITFGTAGAASAPGQIPAEKLKVVLQILSESIE